MKLKVIIKTTGIGCRYQHRVYEKGTQKGGRKISDVVVNMLKKVNEELYREMPDGSKNLVSKIEYKLPKRG